MATEDRVVKVLASVLEIPSESVGPETSIDTVDSWDSIRQINLVLALEEEFGIQLSEEQVIDLLNYPIVLETVKDALGANA